MELTKSKFLKIMPPIENIKLLETIKNKQTKPL